MINFSALRPESLPGRIARFPFRLIPPDLAVPVLQGPLRGKRWIVGSHLHGCWLGSYEWEMQRRIAGQIEPGSVFYDVGANVGFYTLLGALRAGPAGWVYAFEPLPENAAFLRKHLAMNRIRNVEIFETAISDQSGTASFSSESTRAMGKLAAAGTVIVSYVDARRSHRRRANRSSQHDQDGHRRRGVSRTERRPKVFRAIPPQTLSCDPRQAGTRPVLPASFLVGLPMDLPVPRVGGTGGVIRAISSSMKTHGARQRPKK